MKARLSLSISDDAHDSLQGMAKEYGLNRSQAAELCISAFLLDRGGLTPDQTKRLEGIVEGHLRGRPMPLRSEQPHRKLECGVSKVMSSPTTEAPDMHEITYWCHGSCGRHGQCMYRGINPMKEAGC